MKQHDQEPLQLDGSDEAIHRHLTLIASQYKILQCHSCAKEMMTWLKKNSISGILLKIRAKIGYFMVSHRVGGHQSITRNGTHYGVEVRGKVFDNLPGIGMSREEWVNDFDSIGGFVLTEEKF